MNQPSQYQIERAELQDDEAVKNDHVHPSAFAVL
jgi:hypothetical protein